MYEIALSFLRSDYVENMAMQKSDKMEYTDIK